MWHCRSSTIMAVRVLPRGMALRDAVRRLHISSLRHAMHPHGRWLKGCRAAED
jgi:hypothetical protein